MILIMRQFEGIKNSLFTGSGPVNLPGLVKFPQDFFGRVMGILKNPSKNALR